MDRLGEAIELVGWALLGAALLIALVFAGILTAVSAMYARRGVWAARAGGGRVATLALAGLVWRESVAQLQILRWATLHREPAEPLGVSARAKRQPSAERPVVLVHGLAADGNSMRALRRALAQDGRPTWSPHLGPMARDIERYAEQLAPVLRAAVAGAAEDHGIDVVCHSMGGVVLRACLAAHPDLAPHIRGVVCIASPHEGTEVAAKIPLPEARQLLRGAPWLSALPSLRELLPSARIATIASRHDAVVYPHDTSRIPGATHHELEHVGHAELLTRPAVIDLVVAELS